MAVKYDKDCKVKPLIISPLPLARVESSLDKEKVSLAIVLDP